MEPIVLEMKVAHVQDTHLDDAGNVERVATLDGYMPPFVLKPAILGESMEALEAAGRVAEAAQALKDYQAALTAPPPNAVLGIPGFPHLNFAISLRNPGLVGLFMRGRRFRVTIEPEPEG